jgi:putative hydroxymethylpyrimidine transport system substrate-binding protein
LFGNLIRKILVFPLMWFRRMVGRGQSLRLSCWLAAISAIVALPAGCGEGSRAANQTVGPQSSEPVSRPQGKIVRGRSCHSLKQRVTVTLDSYGDAENVGVAIAKRRGFFADAGIHVWAGNPGYPSKPVDYVASAVDDIGLAHLPQTLITKDLGPHLVVVGSVVSQPTTAMIWLKGSKIRTIPDLKGKTVATAGIPYQEAFLKVILEQAGLTLGDVKVKSVSYRLTSTLIKGKADAIFGGSWNLEGKALEARGFEPVVKRVEDLGIPAYDELVVIARAKCVARYPEVARRFMAALSRGTTTAVEHPEVALEALEKEIRPDPEATRKTTKAELKATLPLLSKSGHLAPSAAAGLIDWMYGKGLIQHRLAVAKLVASWERQQNSGPLPRAATP